MPMKIVDADIRTVRSAARAGRARSPETKRLIEAVEGLAPGRAKAVLVDPGETVSRVRARLVYAARVADRKLRVVTDGQRVLFTLRDSRTRRGSRGETSRRREVVLAKALDLAKAGRSQVTAEDVLTALNAEGVGFEVTRPGTMVGAVLRGASEFERIGRNVFRFRGG